MSARRGVTLFELLVSLALTSVVAACVLTLFVSMHAREASAGARAEQLRHARAASDALAAAVRSAHEIRVDDGALVADGVVWRVRDGALERGGVAVVRGMASAEVATCTDGTFRIAVTPSAPAADASAATLTAFAAPRAGGVR